jgi:hypothetical protein
MGGEGEEEDGDDSEWEEVDGEEEGSDDDDEEEEEEEGGGGGKAPAGDNRHLILSNRSAAWLLLGDGAKAMNNAHGAVAAAPDDWHKGHYRVAEAYGKQGGGCVSCRSHALSRPVHTVQVESNLPIALETRLVW